MYTSPISKLSLLLLKHSLQSTNDLLTLLQKHTTAFMKIRWRLSFKSLVQPPTFGHMLIALAMETFLLLFHVG